MKPYVLAALAFVATAFASPTPDVTTLDREPEGPYRNVRLCTVEKFSDGHMRKDCPKISIRIGRCTQFQAPLYRNGLVIFEERRADHVKHFKHMDCVIHSYDCGAKCDPRMSGDKCELRPLAWRHDLKQHISGWENKASSFTCKEFQEPENPPSP
ncbi:hypothetical protein ACCO45_007490 [Purpureocillium lilacinum]|uniref:Uncharacterized protein n=1 Tax=Purpureocillium lilacinum TaxID=33203 RepID=A0ACC4DTH7_PURLI